MQNLRVSHHAKRRFKQRTKLPIRAVYRHAAEAYESGARPRDLHFVQRDRLRAMIKRHDPQERGAFARIAHGVCYIFVPTIDHSTGTPKNEILLVTVLPSYEIEAR